MNDYEQRYQQELEDAQAYLQEKIGTVDMHIIFNDDDIKLVLEILTDEKKIDIGKLVKLQIENGELKSNLDAANFRESLLRDQLNEVTADALSLQNQANQLQADKFHLVEEKKEAQDEARYNLNKTVRMQTEIDTLNMKLSEARKRTEELQPSIGIAKALENAKAAKERIRITVATKADHTGRFYNAHDAQGNQLSIPHLELGKYIQDPTLEIPSLESITQGDIDNQVQAVADAAEAAERFQTTLPDLGGGQSVLVGAEETLADAGADAAPATIKDEIANLKERMLRVEQALNLV